LLAIQAKRTPEDVARIKAEGQLSPYLFASVLGPSFKPDALPATDAMLKRVSADAASVIGQAKAIWDRKRPWVVDERITPCIPKPADASYPSARTVRSHVWASVLGELFPAKKDQLLAAADQVAKNRIEAGVHYPSDIEAGKKLGLAIAAKIIATPAFKSDLTAARAEVAKVKP
jgi:acid phosphatase (class A)